MSAKKKKILRVWGIMIMILLTFGSCSARKNTAPSRFFHSLNSRYNTYFNGKTSFDEALSSLNNGYKENYTEQIHLYPINSMYDADKSATGGPFDRAIEKSDKAIKLHSIKEKPPRKSGWQSDPKQVKLQATEEFNPFMKHCWMLIAESHFYNCDFLTAAVTYSYITRHYSTDPESVAEARIWQARCYTQMDWFYETNNLIKKLNETGIPRRQQKNYDRMLAEYLIKSEQFEQAVPYLQNTIQVEKNKRQRSRMNYLLGQIYQQNGQDELAYQTFVKVASSNPPYEIEFASRIRQTEVFPGNNYEKVLKMLNRMSKSEKNIDFLDQVYYAMGNVFMTQQDTAKAIESYSLGIEKSTQNGMDKAICQICLGDIYFTQKDYLNAQPCFSGALSGIRKEYKDYDRVSRLSETLDELVVYYEAVQLQDSLQVLSRMTEDERLAAIDKIIEQLIEEEKRAAEEAEKEAYLAEQEARNSGFNQMPMMPTSTETNVFYFYNPQTVTQGKTQFENKWGKRTLEDNWRRRDKKMALLLTDEERNVGPTDDNLTEQSDEEQTEQSDSVYDNKSREYYLQQIPLTEDQLIASNEIIIDGLFNMGMIYKDKLEDMNLSVESFEDLHDRFPYNTYRLDYYYQIYLMALRYKDTALAEKYKALLLDDFPSSDYTIAISDPDYEYNMRMMDSVQDSIYEMTYNLYLAEDIEAVRNIYSEFSSKYPLAKLIPKFMFLNALTYVQEGNSEGFKEELTLLTDKYTTDEVTELALEMLRGLLRGRQLMQGSFSTMTWDIRFGMNQDGVLLGDSTATFSDEIETPHRMLLIFSTGNVDRNQLLFTVATYNFANFRVKRFDQSIEQVGTLTILKISGFDNLYEILEYYRMIYGENGYATAFESAVTFFPISDENYNILMRGKTLEEYMRFFIENYSEKSPSLVNRWRMRIDDDRKAIIDEQAAVKKTMESKPAVETVKTIDRKTEETVDVKTTVEDLVKKTDSEKKVEALIDKPSTETTVSLKDKDATTIDDEEEEERPAAKRDNIFKRLFKLLKGTKEFKSLEESFQTLKDFATEELVLYKEKPLERVDGELTFEQIQEIRQREAEEKTIQNAEIALTKEEKEKVADELKKQQAKEKEKLRKEKEKAKKESLKQQKKDQKAKKAAQKAKAKELKATQKAKVKARKAAQKQKNNPIARAYYKSGNIITH